MNLSISVSSVREPGSAVSRNSPLFDDSGHRADLRRYLLGNIHFFNMGVSCFMKLKKGYVYEVHGDIKRIC